MSLWVKMIRMFSFSNIKYFVALVVVFALVALSVSISKTYLFPDELKAISSYHGPNPNSKLDTSESVLGRKTTRYISPSPTPLPSPPVIFNKPGEYGVAAAGGLIYLDQANLDKYFKNLQELGVKWVRWDIEWGAVQPDSSASYNWTSTDQVVQTAKVFGINSLGTIAYAPRWARDSQCSDKFTCQPADPNAFGVFAGQVALRYKDSINYWEIWNEPNILPFWRPRPNVIKYIDILKAAYTQIKMTNAQAVVLVGGLTASGNDPDGSLSPLNFINQMYSLGAKDYFDAVALHPYTFPVLPEYPASWNSWQQMASIHQLMIAKGDKNKKIWVTEYGVPTSGPGTVREINQFSFIYGRDFMSEATQQEMARQALSYYRQNRDWMGPLFWYSLHDNGSNTDTPENFFGLLRYDWTKKPAYDVFRNAILTN